MHKFDLTTINGVKKAEEFFGLSLGLGLGLFNPTLVLGKWLIDKLFSTPEEESRAISQLIEKGRQDGVSEMEIIIKDKGGLNLNVPIEDCKIEAHAGKNQKTIIKVKYK